MGIVECIGKLVESFASLGLLLAMLALIQKFENSRSQEFKGRSSVAFTPKVHQDNSCDGRRAPPHSLAIYGATAPELLQFLTSLKTPRSVERAFFSNLHARSTVGCS